MKRGGKWIGWGALAVVVMIVLEGNALAQMQLSSQAPRAKRAQRIRSSYGGSGQGQYGDSVYNRPTVSPYLNLTRPQGLVTMPNYQSLVQPQMQQQRNNAQQGAALRSLQRQVGSLEGQIATMRPTGHETRFMETFRYFGTYGNNQTNRR